MQVQLAPGPDGSLVVTIPTLGGSVLAILDPSGQPCHGWPISVTRAGSEFWSVAVGPDGTVYALAIEPESSRTSSASILTFAPDSTVRYSTTIIEP